MRSKIAIGLCILFSLLFQSATWAQEEFDHVDGDILVRIKDKHAVEWLLTDVSIHKGLHTQLNTEECLSKHMNIWKLTFNTDNFTHNQILDIIQQHESVADAQLNYVFETRATPNDPSYNQQWQYEQTSDNDLDAEAAWDITTGGVTALGDTIVVCVIDDGLEVSHPDWGDNIWYNNHEINGNGIDDDGNGYIDDYRGWNANAGTNDITPPNPWNTHGTPVAGIVGAKGNNGVGVSGVNWNVKVMFVIGGGNSAQAIAAYSYPLECRKLYNQTNGAKGAFVVATNASWGVDQQDCATFGPLMNDLYDTLGVYGVLNAAATTNSNTNVDTQGDFPTSCASDYMIAVTNMNQAGNKVNQAGYGANTVDLGAFGEGTYTIATGASYGGFGGTSGATPHVAGTIGLMYSAPCPRFAQMARSQPQQTADLVRQLLLNSTVPNTTLQGITVSEGVLNMKNALDSIMAIGCSLSGCHEPYNPAANNITGTASLVNWDGVDSTTLYYIRYRETGTTAWTTTTSPDTFVNITSLVACTDYEVQVAANCDSTNFSATLSFKTGDCCNPPSSITVGAIATTTADFTWTTDPFVNSYTVEYKLKSASTWQTASTTTGSISLSGLDSCEIYEIRIVGSCPVNVNNQYSPVVEFETIGCGKCTSSNYCTSTGQASGDDWIQSVSFGSINNNTGNDGGYVSFVNSGPTTDVMPGVTYPISIDIGYNTGNWATNWVLKVWIDYNQDEVFDDATELAYDTLITTAAATHSGNIMIPNNALLSRTRMRVALKWGNGNNPLNPCDNSQYGETEDYCINVITATNLNNIAEQSGQNLTVYPNPFKQHLTLAINSVLDQDARVTVHTITGQEVININQALNKGLNTLPLASKSLPQGMYLVSVHLADGSTLSQKVVKQ